MTAEKKARPGDPRRELWSLVATMCDGTITPSARDRLETRLRNDAEARQLYVAYTDLHAQMLWHLRKAASERAVLGPKGMPPETPTAPNGAPTAEAEQSWGMPGNPILRSVVLGSVIGLPIAVLLLVVAGQLVPQRWLRGPAPEREHAAQPVEEPTYVARIAETVDCRWGSGQPGLEAGSRLSGGQKVILEEGWVEITFDRGARAVLQGPAAFEGRSSGSVWLAEGTLSARVPPEAAGFAVETPAMTVVDRGTEFGVSVAGSGSAEVHVFEGKVEAAPAGGKADALQGLVAGKGLRVQPGGQTTPLEADPAAFVRVGELQQAEDSPLFREWRRYRDRLCDDPDVVLFYDFQRRPDGILRNVAADALHGRIDQPDGPRWTRGRWRLKGALRFAGNERVVVADRPELRLSGDFTVALWLRLMAVSPRRALLIGKGSGEKRNYSLWVGLATRDADPAGGGWVHWSVWSARQGNRYVDSRTRLRPGRWHHVAGVVQKNALRLYVDGKEDTSAVTLARPVARDPSPLLVGRSDEPTHPEGLQGTIDEITLVQRALSGEEIARLARMRPMKDAER